MTDQLAWADVATIALLALLATLAVGAVGSWLLWLARGRSLQALVPGVAVVTMLAAVAGVVGAAAAMFLSPHDLQVVLVVAVTAGAVGAAIALILGHAVLRGSRTLTTAAEQLGAGEQPVIAVRPVSAELAAVAGALEQAGTQLREAREQREAVEASRRELVSWVSHDLRTPLAGMRAMAEALEDGMVDDPSVYHRQIRREVDRLSGLVDDLFELSRIRAGALRLSMDQVSLEELVAQSVGDADPLARSRGVRVEGSYDAVAVQADRDELARALANLVVNAIRHTPHDGTVQVSAERVGNDAVLSVQDACGGIAEDDLERVFETGFRAESSRTPSPDAGGGIGLAIVAGIVQAHHGTVDVENHGPGCRFAIRLPLSVAG